MSSGTDEDRRWAADKRDFVADSRDDVADRRDALADERDRIADAREASADAREAAADAREGALDESEQRWRTEAAEPEAEVLPDAGVGEREDGRVARAEALEARQAADQERREAGVERDATIQRRLAELPPTLLAAAFARIAEYLYDASTYDEELTKVAEAAVATITGGQVASVTLQEKGRYRTSASTGAAATAVDQAQYDADEGPCLDALEAPVVDVPAFPDDRWPVLGARPAEHGVQSSASFRLGAVSHGGASSREAGSLNVYGLTPAAFGAEALEIGSILAAHAALAARAVGERATLDGLARNLRKALLSRDVIGQAKGILMERLKTTPEEAFDILRRSSMRLNLKLREVARRLAETGELEHDDREPR